VIWPQIIRQGGGHGTWDGTRESDVSEDIDDGDRESF
jgi:hypothetical protein